MTNKESLESSSPEVEELVRAGEEGLNAMPKWKVHESWLYPLSSAAIALILIPFGLLHIITFFMGWYRFFTLRSFAELENVTSTRKLLTLSLLLNIISLLVAVMSGILLVVAKNA